MSNKTYDLIGAAVFALILVLLLTYGQRVI
jgi:uncharacterized membrane protein